MRIVFKRISSIFITIIVIITFSFLDNNFYTANKVYAEDVKAVTISIVKDFSSNNTENILYSQTVTQGDNYNLPSDNYIIYAPDDNYITLGYEDENGNIFKTGDSINTNNITGDIKYKPICVKAVCLKIMNPVTKKLYEQKVVKDEKIDSETVVTELPEQLTAGEINKKILNDNSSYKDFDEVIKDIGDKDNPLIKDKLQLDDPMLVYRYQDSDGRQEELKSSINEINFKYNSTMLFNYYANVTIKDEQGNIVSEKGQYKVKYLESLSGIKLKSEEGQEFKNWVTSSDNLVKNNDGTWTLKSVSENTNLVAAFSDKILYSFNDSQGNEILSKYKGTVGKGGAIILPNFESDDINEITPEGKKIIGFKDQNGNVYTDIINNVQGNLILVPQFGDKVCLSYQTDENKSLHDVGIGQSVKLLNGPQKSQVIFKCWRDSSGKDYNPGDTIKITGDTNLKAVYEVKITYKNSDDTILCEKNFEVGDKITYPEPPESQDISLTFDMWYPILDNAEKNAEVKAEYKVKEFSVTYDALEGINQTVKYGQDIELTNIIPYKHGYTFKGWSSDGKNITQDTVINAIFEINKYTVSFDGKEQIVEYGQDAIEPEPPKKEGYIFLRWSMPSKNIQNNLEIVSEFVPIQCKVTINGDIQYVEYGQDAIMPEKNPEKAGYTFKGWTSDGKNIKNDMVIEAIFEKNQQDNEAPQDGQDEHTADTNNLFILVMISVSFVYYFKYRKVI